MTRASLGLLLLSKPCLSAVAAELELLGMLPVHRQAGTSAWLMHVLTWHAARGRSVDWLSGWGLLLTVAAKAKPMDDQPRSRTKSSIARKKQHECHQPVQLPQLCTLGGACVHVLCCIKIRAGPCRPRSKLQRRVEADI
jgi:hypothetical protein